MFLDDLDLCLWNFVIGTLFLDDLELCLWIIVCGSLFLELLELCFWNFVFGSWFLDLCYLTLDLVWGFTLDPKSSGINYIKYYNIKCTVITYPFS